MLLPSAAAGSAAAPLALSAAASPAALRASYSSQARLPQFQKLGTPRLRHSNICYGVVGAAGSAVCRRCFLGKHSASRTAAELLSAQRLT
jgi:hypothetical protein